MGIPGFNRWLHLRCRRAIVNVKEGAPTVVNGVEVPVDTTAPNPNKMEFDNLYIDFNGILHPCFHPEEWPAPSSYDEVFKSVFKYVDRIFSLIRPRKLLFLAIDGVAPRAKLNQQRSRRFRAAAEAKEAENSKDKCDVTCDKLVSEIMDSNIITPGTEFMATLSVALQYYIRLRLNTDPGWRGIKVILSDATVPGEGEHKVASYIRSQRNLPGFDPNTRHCFYGLDADLVMLALATHEIHFSVLRENSRSKKDMRKNTRRLEKRKRSMVQNSKKAWQFESNEDVDYIKGIKFQFVHIWILRDYLEHQLTIPESPMKTNLERLIDDFVFMCLFVGNDFLPNIPSLEISEGAIDLLIKIYKKEFTKMGGYLTNSFEVDLGRVEHFLQAVGSHETDTLKRRLKFKNKMNVQPGKDTDDSGQDDGWNWIYGPESRDMLQKELSNGNMRCKVGAVEEGWKERYYHEKFDITNSTDLSKLKDDMVLKYVEGVCWFMYYYYQGLCSWQWFYPYHYAPFASDFIDLKSFDISFTLGKPFKPFDQLMSVLPAASAHALPVSYRKLMTEPSSSIKDFYPEEFSLDMNGKTYDWQAVCKLPFIDESRLIEQIEQVEHNLMDEERKRNLFSMGLLFLHASHRMAPKVISFYEKKRESSKLIKAKLKKKIRPKLRWHGNVAISLFASINLVLSSLNFGSLSDGMNGFIYISDKTIQSSEIFSPVDGMETIRDNQTIVVYYKGPPMHLHISKIPEGATLPRKFIIKKRDSMQGGKAMQDGKILGKRKWITQEKSYSAN